MPKRNPDDFDWHKRVSPRFEEDILAAKKILAEHRITPTDALKAVKYVHVTGSTRVFHPDAPKELQDPTNQCFYALRILMLEQDIHEADPKALQIGKRWGQAAIGLGFPDIANSMRNWSLNQNRGPGGAKANDLSRTLQYILRDKPDANRKYVIDYLQSEEAEDFFHLIEDPPIHITNVELDEQSKTLTYEDRGRRTQTIKTSTLDRKIRGLRAK